MSVSETDVRRVAALAKLDIDDARLGVYAGELNRILQHMDVLQSVDVAAHGATVVPTTRTADALAGQAIADTTSAAPLRDDSGDSVPLARAIGDFAPAERDGFFLVPRLATHE